MFFCSAKKKIYSFLLSHLSASCVVDCANTSHVASIFPAATLDVDEEDGELSAPHAAAGRQCAAAAGFSPLLLHHIWNATLSSEGNSI